MYKAERLDIIRKHLLKKKQADIKALQAMFGVSAVTIRSDLDDLQAEGFAIRTHGGVILSESTLTEEQAKGFFVGNQVPYERKKEIIGEIAASIIFDNEWIFLGSGTTAYYIARALVKRPNLNVLTNNLMVAYELSKNISANVIMTGGVLSHNTHNLGGEIFAAYLKDIIIAKAFISIAGIEINRGYTVTTAGEFNVFKVIRDISNEMFIVADDSKFDLKKFIRVGELDDADAIITNQAITSPYKEYYEERGIRVITPETQHIAEL